MPVSNSLDDISTLSNNSPRKPVLGAGKLIIVMLKAEFNKLHKNRNSDISLINRVSYQLQILFWCPENQNEFYKHKNMQPHCGKIKSDVQFLFA
jgi:hypothetical protein